MDILIACERSGIVRDAFNRRGHSAISCDLEPSDRHGPHYRGDIRDLLGEPWDLVIAFPPCTHLAVSGAKHFAVKRADGRQAEGVAFFRLFLAVECDRVAIENPVGVMSRLYKKPDQIVQPYHFGDPFTKSTCLWLRGLPKLTPTLIVERGARHLTKSGRSLPAWYNLPPGPDRARIRSNTFPGIADAMAIQWGQILNDR